MSSRPGLAVAVLAVFAVVFTGCSAQPETQQVAVEMTSSTGVDLSGMPGVAENRAKILELCNTGPGAAEMDKAWVDAGYAESSGKTWLETVEYFVDYAFMTDPNAIANNAEYTYPMILAVSENCSEVGYIFADGISLANTKDALPTVEAFRSDPDVAAVINALYGGLPA